MTTLAPAGPGSNGIYSDSRIMWSSGGWTYNVLAGASPTLTPRVDTRTNTLIADLLPIFKRHSRIAFNDDDDLCELYLLSAISRIEQWCYLPIAPVSYDWAVPETMMDFQGYELPLRNCSLQGDQYGFELLISRKVITKPAQWPVLLELGFTSGDKVPADLKLSIFELALSLYENRSSAEMQEVYARQVMVGNLSRYWVPRC